MKSVYSAVQTGSLNKAVCASSLKGIEDNDNYMFQLSFLQPQDGLKRKAETCSVIVF